MGLWKGEGGAQGKGLGEERKRGRGGRVVFWPDTQTLTEQTSSTK